jgi:hypothetical protein
MGGHFIGLMFISGVEQYRKNKQYLPQNNSPCAPSFTTQKHALSTYNLFSPKQAKTTSFEIDSSGLKIISVVPACIALLLYRKFT